MGTGNIQIRYEDRRSALEAYQGGLRHGMLTLPLDEKRKIGDQVDVVLRLPFVDVALQARGWVVHASEVATVVRLEKVPTELHRIAAGDASAGRRAGWSTADPYPVSEDASADGPRTTTLDRDSATPASGRRPSYLARRLRQSLEDRTSSDGYEAVAPRPSVAREPARPPATSPQPPAEATVESMSRGPGIPVPGDPNRHLPGIARFEGPLENSPPYQVLLQLYTTRSTGVLVVELGDVRYWGFFLGGRPVHYLRYPPLQSESTEALLVRKQLLSKPVLDRARWHAEITGQPLVSIVMRMRLIKEQQLHDLRTSQIKLVTRRLLDLGDGFYRFFETADLREVFRNPPLDPVPLIWKRAMFSMANRNEAQIQALLEPLLDQGVNVTSLGRQIARKLPLDESRRDLVRALATGKTTVALAIRGSRLRERECAELLTVMQQLGLIRFVRVRRRITPEVAQCERALKAQGGRLQLDHYTFLELHWSALPDELEAACARLETKIRDLTEPCNDQPGIMKLCAPLVARLREVRELVQDDEARRSYRAEVVGESERAMAAEMYLKQGEMALFRRDRDQACECFSRLVEVDPGGAGSRERLERARRVLGALVEGQIPAAN